ncbi:RimK family alpha-L-glutamate ligase [Dyadobacter sp. CY351]|uniref:ATP-grasp domain-containing protein n=1 Tax=Dyadobacter sp. CY351 TaxID=2909337 RepID=UPI001F415611|nr:ATP-grasp domain-containing protein [Dyadobacter sp. CY351]MCF2518531.1 ATP-grasp domain-containing protein [Dyadobacter sp. CY351]
MARLGICTTARSVAGLSYEGQSLYGAALELYDEVLLIDPREVTYKLIRDKEQPEIIFKGVSIADMNSLLIRSTKGIEIATAVLARVCVLLGCDVVDPVERFSIGKASKVITTISRFNSNVGTSSYFCFSSESAIALFQDLDLQGQFPLLTKPVSGSQGEGVLRLNNLDGALNYVRIFFQSDGFSKDPLLVQSFVEFEKEFRLLIFDGEVLGIAEKFKKRGSYVANAHQGGEFVRSDRPDLASAAVELVSEKGLLGVDVGLDASGNLHIIESNRAPQWHAFEKALEINVAKEILTRLVGKMRFSNSQ